MAPRGRSRPRKNAVGETRMDAALDAMRPYGFPESLVRVTVKELLDVYGGNDGWMFIEEVAYMLLIETLLVKQNQGADQDEDDACQESEMNIDKSEALTPGTQSSFPDFAKLGPSDAISHSHADNIASATNGSGPSGCNHQVQLAESCVVKEEIMERTLLRSPPPSKSLSHVESFSAQCRRPYYGWISDDDEDEDDLVELPAAPMPAELEKLLKGNI